MGCRMKAKRIKYDCVFSLGEVCFCANYLRALSLRKFSSPFDWIAGATFNERMKFFLNGFEDYLNKEDLVYHGKRDFPEPCDIYYNTRTHIIFNHDFPLAQPFDEAFSKVKERYNRRIKRLYALIHRAKKVLIVYMEKYDTNSNVNDDAQLCSLMEEVNGQFPGTHIDLLYIRHDESMADGEYSRTRISKYVVVGKCFNKSREDNSPALGNFHNVKLILKDIRCKDNLFNSSMFFFHYWITKVYKTIYRHKIKNGEEYIRFFGVKIYRRKIEEGEDKFYK